MNIINKNNINRIRKIVINIVIIISILALILFSINTNSFATTATENSSTKENVMKTINILDRTYRGISYVSIFGYKNCFIICNDFIIMDYRSYDKWESNTNTR